MDAVILVFSLENEASFQEVYKIYHQLAAHRPVSEIPFVVVGTQGELHTTRTFQCQTVCRGGALLVTCVVFLLDKISSTNPRVIDDAKARQLCSDVRRCTYYETCATYGLNVNRVFNDGTSPLMHIKSRQENWEAQMWMLHASVWLISSFCVGSTAAQKIMTAKKQAAVLASCRSLPNSPSHSGGSTPVSGVFPGQVRPFMCNISYWVCCIFYTFCWIISAPVMNCSLLDYCPVHYPVLLALLFRPVMVVRAVITPHHFPPHLSSAIKRLAGQLKGKNRKVPRPDQSAVPPGDAPPDSQYVHTPATFSWKLHIQSMFGWFSWIRRRLKHHRLEQLKKKTSK